MPEQSRDIVAESAKLARQVAQPVDVGNSQVVVVPLDMKLVDLTPHLYSEVNHSPIRVRSTVSVSDAESFLHYYSLYSIPSSVIFAEEETQVIESVLDYHDPARTAAGQVIRWGQHRVVLRLRPSAEWSKWTSQSGKKTSQMDFAEFLEDNAPDIVSPSAATMIEVARDLSAKGEVDFASAISLKNGSVQFRYSEQVKGTYGSGNIDVPGQFSVSIPVFRGGGCIELGCRLRYRLNGGKLTFWFDLLRADAAHSAAFVSVVSQISSAIEETKVISGAAPGAQKPYGPV